MLIDHIAFWLVNNNNVMRNIERFTFAIYAFLIAESYFHLKKKTDRLRSHMLKLLFLSIVSEPLRDQYILYKMGGLEISEYNPFSDDWLCRPDSYRVVERKAST